MQSRYLVQIGCYCVNFYTAWINCCILLFVALKCQSPFYEFSQNRFHYTFYYLIHNLSLSVLHRYQKMLGQDTVSTIWHNIKSIDGLNLTFYFTKRGLLARRLSVYKKLLYSIDYRESSNKINERGYEKGGICYTTLNCGRPVRFRHVSSGMMLSRWLQRFPSL